ncbi:proteasome regulatory particle lid subunit [Martiniozyma asiatica (nom. inval.)]|nr:proteasome regulatory particle lid subunit [Martiniozyma asiatica]
MTKSVSIAPLVLLSAVDHYERVLRNSDSTLTQNKRVVGVILGDSRQNEIRVTNSFAIPFEEDPTNENIWFLDHNYIENMMEMFKKINAKEKLIGWYHTGPKVCKNDLKINELFKKFTTRPLLVVVDVNGSDSVNIPTDCYTQVEDTFIHHSSFIEAEEAEEIGVEHLLRDIRDENSGNLTISLSNNFKSLSGLSDRLSNIVNYLGKIISGKLPINHDILGKLQDIFNLLPNITGILIEDGVEIENGSKSKLGKTFNEKTNDQLMVIYVSSLVRSIIAFHELIENKIANQKRTSDEL